MSLLEQLGSISRHDERPRPAALASADVKIQQRPKVTQEELSLALLAVFADPGLQEQAESNNIKVKCCASRCNSKDPKSPL